jgi:uncharacterized membrane protein (DUF485 family)
LAIQADDKPLKNRVRNRALVLMTLALVFYFGFIAVTYYHSHH